MYNYSRDGIDISAMIDARTIIADGKHPVRIRVNHQRKRKYIPTGKSLTKEKWKSLANTRSRALNDIKKSVEESFYVVKEYIDALCQKEDFNKKHIKNIPSDIVNSNWLKHCKKFWNKTCMSSN